MTSHRWLLASLLSFTLGLIVALAIGSSADTTHNLQDPAAELATIKHLSTD